MPPRRAKSPVPVPRRTTSPAPARSPGTTRPRWNEATKIKLQKLVTDLQGGDPHRPLDWNSVAQQLGGTRSAAAVQQHWRVISSRLSTATAPPAAEAPADVPAAISQTATPSSAFLFSPTLDAVGFVLPLVLSLALTPAYWFVPRDHVPLWAYLALVVFSDVAHVWASAFRTYLDTREFARRRRMLAAGPFGAFALGFALHEGVSPSAFWTCLAYYAIWHFLKQAFSSPSCLISQLSLLPAAPAHALWYLPCPPTHSLALTRSHSLALTHSLSRNSLSLNSRRRTSAC